MQQDAAAKGWDTGYEWKIILILSLTFGLVGLDRFILPVLFPAFMDELGLTYEEVGDSFSDVLATAAAAVSILALAQWLRCAWQAAARASVGNLVWQDWSEFGTERPAS